MSHNSVAKSIANPSARPATLLGAFKQIAGGLVTAVLLDAVAKALEKGLDDRIRAAVMAETADVYAHLLRVEECVTILGERLNRMQEGLRVLGSDGAEKPKS